MRIIGLDIHRAFAEAVGKGRRPSVIWLSFQECTGCTESLLRTTKPALDELILDLISLDYHEALMVPSGHRAEATRMKAMEANRGKFIANRLLPILEVQLAADSFGRIPLKQLLKRANVKRDRHFMTSVPGVTRKTAGS